MAAVFLLPPAMPTTRLTCLSSASSMLITRSLSGVCTGTPAASKKRRQMSPTAPRALSDLSSCGEKTLPLGGEELRRLDRADADERERDRLEQRRRFLDVAVLEHDAPGVRRPHGARCRQGAWRCPRRGSRAGASDASRALPPRDCRCRRESGPRGRLRRGDSGASPRPSPEATRSTTKYPPRPWASASSPDRRPRPRPGRARSDLPHRSASTTMASRSPNVVCSSSSSSGMQAGGHAERDADDALFLGALQQPGDGGLMDVQTFGDLRLTQACAVIEARNLREKTQLVDARHGQPLPP